MEKLSTLDIVIKHSPHPVLFAKGDSLAYLDDRDCKSGREARCAAGEMGATAILVRGTNGIEAVFDADGHFREILE